VAEALIARQGQNRILVQLPGIEDPARIKDLLGDHATHWMSIFGVALITVIVFSPTGIAGALGRLLSGGTSKAGAAKPAAAH